MVVAESYEPGARGGTFLEGKNRAARYIVVVASVSMILKMGEEIKVGV